MTIENRTICYIIRWFTRWTITTNSTIFITFKM